MIVIATVWQQSIGPTTDEPIQYLHGIAATPSCTATSPDAGPQPLSSIHNDGRRPWLNWTALACSTTVTVYQFKSQLTEDYYLLSLQWPHHATLHLPSLFTLLTKAMLK